MRFTGWLAGGRFGGMRWCIYLWICAHIYACQWRRNESHRGQAVKKPDWWPVNPYPPDIFIGRRDELATLIPDPNIRTKIAGIMGRMFWDIASDMIWNRMASGIEGRLCPVKYGAEREMELQWVCETCGHREEV